MEMLILTVLEQAELLCKIGRREMNSPARRRRGSRHHASAPTPVATARTAHEALGLESGPSPMGRSRPEGFRREPVLRFRPTKTKHLRNREKLTMSALASLLTGIMRRTAPVGRADDRASTLPLHLP